MYKMLRGNSIDIFYFIIGSIYVRSMPFLSCLYPFGSSGGSGGGRQWGEDRGAAGTNRRYFLEDSEEKACVEPNIYDLCFT